MREPTECWQYCQNQSIRGYSSSCYTKRGSLKKVLRLSRCFSPWSSFVFTHARSLLSLFPNHQEPGTSYHLSFASFESLGIGCCQFPSKNSQVKMQLHTLAQPLPPPHQQTIVMQECNNTCTASSPSPPTNSHVRMQLHFLNPFPFPTHKQTIMQECNYMYTCSAPSPTPPIKKQSCKNATTLPQPLLPLHQQSCEIATTLAQPHPSPHQQTVMWECNYTCSAPPSSPPTNIHVRMQLHLLSPTLFPTSGQSCENATTLAQPHPLPHIQTVMWKYNYTCLAPPPPHLQRVMRECNYTCSPPPPQPTYMHKQSCENATTLTQPLLPHHIQRNSHVRMQIHLLSPSSHPSLQTNSHVQMQLQSWYR